MRWAFGAEKLFAAAVWLDLRGLHKVRSQSLTNCLQYLLLVICYLLPVTYQHHECTFTYMYLVYLPMYISYSPAYSTQSVYLLVYVRYDVPK